MTPNQRITLKDLFEEYDHFRKRVGVSKPGEVIWFAENFPDRKYEAVADGLGGAEAIVYEGNPGDCLCHYRESFDTEDAAVEAIKIKAKAGGAWEDEEDELPASKAEDDL
jgi:hypothetical protein